MFNSVLLKNIEDLYTWSAVERAKPYIPLYFTQLHVATSTCTVAGILGIEQHNNDLSFGYCSRNLPVAMYIQ
jgi:hypothetical protein